MVERLPSIYKDQGSILNTSISKNPLLNEIISLKHLIFAEYHSFPLPNTSCGPLYWAASSRASQGSRVEGTGLAPTKNQQGIWDICCVPGLVLLIGHNSSHLTAPGIQGHVFISDNSEVKKCQTR